MKDLNLLSPSPDALLQQKTLIEELAQDAVLEEVEGNNAGEGAKNDVEEPASALKLDELLQTYPRCEVEKAIVYFDYPEQGNWLPTYKIQTRSDYHQEKATGD